MLTMAMMERQRRPNASTIASRLVCGLLLTLAVSLSGCSASRLSYYDPTTFHGLTALKPKVVALYDTFTQDPLQEDKLAEIRLELAQIVEYEKGKGESNRETAQQVQKIREIFDRHVENRKQGKWSKVFMEEAQQNIGDAFDLAIRTERLKNKNE